MAVGGLTRRWAAAPWWLPVLLVFLLSRVVTTAILLAFAAAQGRNAWTGPSPGYADFASIWDGHWYYVVAFAGYPQQLPLTADGQIAENAWAFMPAYPAVVRLVSTISGAPFDVSAVAVSVLFALAAALVFYRLMSTVLPDSTAMFAVVLFCVAPLSPILQVAYAESMHLFLLTLALLLLVRRRFWLLLPVIPVMALTRPSGLAFALCLGLYAAWRYWRRRRDPFPASERVPVLLSVLLSGVSGLAWPAIAWAVTGSITAYTDTELAWRAPYIGYQHLVPFAPWVQGATWWLGLPEGIIALLLVLGLYALALASPWVRRLGPETWFWVLSYSLYLLAVFFPQSSTFRLLVPLFPLLGALAVPRAWWYRITLVLAFIAAQIGWVYIAWWVDGYDWTPP